VCSVRFSQETATVFPVRYELILYILFRRNYVFKGLNYQQNNWIVEAYRKNKTMRWKYTMNCWDHFSARDCCFSLRHVQIDCGSLLASWVPYVHGSSRPLLSHSTDIPHHISRICRTFCSLCCTTVSWIKFCVCIEPRKHGVKCMTASKSGDYLADMRLLSFLKPFPGNRNFVLCV
jgi:hypothetical protein